MDFHPWKSSLKSVIALPEQHYNNPNHTRQTCPHVGPMPVEAVPFGLIWIWPAMPSHPYKTLGLWTRSLRHRQETFLSLSEELGPSRHFPLAIGTRSPHQLQTPIILSYCLCFYQTTTSSSCTLHVDADGLLTCSIQASIVKVMAILTLAVPGATPRLLLS